MTKAASHTISSRDWLGKVSAAVVLGYTLSIALSGLFSLYAPGAIESGKVQFNMWIVSPLWTAILSTCFFFRNTLSAWLWLGGANVIAFALLFAGR